MTETKSNLMDQIKQYRYPACSKGQVHDYLNMVCVDERCDETQHLEALCSMCIDNNFHRKAYHIHKNLKKFLRDLLQLTEGIDNTEVTEDEVEKRFKWLAKEFQNKGNQCFEVAKNVLASLEQYRTARGIVSPEKVAVRKIIEDILIKENERNLQGNLKNLMNYIQIEGGMLRITGSASREYKMEIEKNADNFLIALEDALTKLNNLNLDLLSTPNIGKKISVNVISKLPVEQSSQNASIRNEYERDVQNSFREADSRRKREESPQRQKEDMAEKEYTRSMWSSELKRIALKIETIKRVAIEEANRKGTHGYKDYWRDFEELSSNAKSGWGIDGKHNTYPNSQPMYCFKCFPIYQDALKAIESLKKEYSAIEEKMRTMTFYE